jgi:hypothetical protein
MNKYPRVSFLQALLLPIWTIGSLHPIIAQFDKLIHRLRLDKYQSDLSQERFAELYQNNPVALDGILYECFVCCTESSKARLKVKPALICEKLLAALCRSEFEADDERFARYRRYVFDLAEGENDLKTDDIYHGSKATIDAVLCLIVCRVC